MKLDLTKLLGFRIIAEQDTRPGVDDKAVRLSAKIGDKAGGKPTGD